MKQLRHVQIDDGTRLVTLVAYSDLIDLPPAGAWHPASPQELEECLAWLESQADGARQTEWSRRAWETDRRALARALELARAGVLVYTAEDDDGVYCAVATGAQAFPARQG